MKLTDFLSDVGRPVAYYPELRKITGSTNATILLCQFIYWRGKEVNHNGWLYKTSDDIEKETGLSYGEQKTARRDLIEAGLLDEHYARLDHQMRFKLNIETINEKWGKLQTEIPESGKPQFGNEGNPLSLNESETTTETTIEPPLSSKEIEQVKAKVYAIIGNSGRVDSWEGREIFAPQHFPLVDWYHKVTGQSCPKSKRKDWMRAVSMWAANGLTVENLQAAYDMDIKWRTVFTSPNQLTDKAIAIKAQPHKDEARPNYDALEAAIEREKHAVPRPAGLVPNIKRGA